MANCEHPHQLKYFWPHDVLLNYVGVCLECLEGTLNILVAFQTSGNRWTLVPNVKTEIEDASGGTLMEYLDSLNREQTRREENIAAAPLLAKAVMKEMSND